MSKFKVGDKIIVEESMWAFIGNGSLGVICSISTEYKTCWAKFDGVEDSPRDDKGWRLMFKNIRHCTPLEQLL